MERIIFVGYKCTWPVPVAAHSNARDCGRSLAGNVGSNPDVGMDVCIL